MYSYFLPRPSWLECVAVLSVSDAVHRRRTSRFCGRKVLLSFGGSKPEEVTASDAKNEAASSAEQRHRQTWLLFSASVGFK